MPDSESPLVDLSTTSAFFWHGPSEPPAGLEEWQLVRVVLAQITPQIYGLTVCPVLDCGLARRPVTPCIEMLVPDPCSDVIFQERAKRVIVRRVEESTREQKFYLSFDDMLEFWDFVVIVGQLRSREEVRKADALEKLSLVRLFVPYHGPGGIGDVMCHNAEHLDDGTLATSPSSSSTVTLA